MTGAPSPRPAPTGQSDRLAELHAPVQWQAVDFISDLHLQSGDAATADAWLDWLDGPASSRTDAVVILGDLFEVWIGDDVLETSEAACPEAPFLRRCADALQRLSQTVPVYFMAGNRDFLLGESAARRCGLTLLPDPTVLQWHGQRWLLSHGDSLCLADVDYQRFRQQVRSQDWQADFLRKPLVERENLARQLRQQSQDLKRRHAHDPSLWADVDAQAAADLVTAAGARGLIHGHTHRPARHMLAAGQERWVLSDWDMSADPPRAQILRLDAQGLHRLPLKAV